MNTEYKTFREIPYRKVINNQNGRELYVCNAFDEQPYRIKSFSTVTESDMYRFINHYLDNKDFYMERYDLNNKAAEEFYSGQ